MGEIIYIIAGSCPDCCAPVYAPQLIIPAFTGGNYGMPVLPTPGQVQAVYSCNCKKRRDDRDDRDDERKQQSQTGAEA